MFILDFLTLSITLTIITGEKTLLYVIINNQKKGLQKVNSLKVNVFFLPMNMFECCVWNFLMFLSRFIPVHLLLILRDNHAPFSPFVHLLLVFHVHIFFHLLFLSSDIFSLLITCQETHLFH